MYRSSGRTRNFRHLSAATRWDVFGDEEFGAREVNLLSENNWLGQMTNGSMGRRHYNTTGGALAMIDERVQRSPAVLNEVRADRSIDAALKSLSRRHKKDKEEIEYALAKAIEVNEGLQKELKTVKKKLADQIAAMEKKKSEPPDLSTESRVGYGTGRAPSAKPN